MSNIYIRSVLYFNEIFIQFFKTKQLGSNYSFLNPSNSNLSNDNKDKYVIKFDTKKIYRSQTVEFVKTKEAFWGSGQVRFIKGKDTLQII